MLAVLVNGVTIVLSFLDLQSYIWIYILHRTGEDPLVPSNTVFMSLFDDFFYEAHPVLSLLFASPL